MRRKVKEEEEKGEKEEKNDKKEKIMGIMRRKTTIGKEKRQKSD